MGSVRTWNMQGFTHARNANTVNYIIQKGLCIVLPSNGCVIPPQYRSVIQLLMFELSIVAENVTIYYKTHIYTCIAHANKLTYLYCIYLSTKQFNHC